MKPRFCKHKHVEVTSFLNLAPLFPITSKKWVVMCRQCGLRTALYKTKNEALNAWYGKNKGE